MIYKLMWRTIIQTSIFLVLVLVCLFVVVTLARRDRTQCIVDDYVEQQNLALEANVAPRQIYQRTLNAMLDAAANMRRRLAPLQRRAIPQEPPALPELANNITFILNRRPTRPHMATIREDLDLQIALLQSMATEFRRRAAAATRALRQAAEPPASAAPAATEYFDRAKQVRSDKQNVHDTAVNIHLRDTFAKLHHDTSHDAELHAFMNAKLSNAAKETLRFIVTENPVVYSLGGNARLADVLYRVWSRSYAPENANNAAALRDALAAAIEDCIENGSRVCTGGITARLLASPILLDHDPSIGHVETLEQYKNDILTKASKLLEDLTREAGTKLSEAAFADEYSRRVDAMLEAVEPQFRPAGIKDMIMAAIA